MSSQKILDAIMDDARRECDGIIAAAEKSAAQSREQALAAAAERSERHKADIERECADITARARQNASLTARKNTLAAKRTLIDRAFDGALEQMNLLGDDQYAALVSRLVCAASENGSEYVSVPKHCRARYTKPFIGGKNMLEILNAAYKEKSGSAGSFKLSEGETDFSGGVKLIGDRADFDCSFETLLAEWREQNEAAVYEMLFKKEG